MDTGLAPGFVRITYTGIGGIHHATIPVNIDPDATPGIEPDLTLKDASTSPAGTAIEDYVDAWANLLSSSQNIGLAEVYTVNSVTGEGTFIWGFDLGRAGENASPSLRRIGGQVTFKLISGRTFRGLAMEGVTILDIDQRPPFSGGSPQRLYSDYVVSDASMVYGRGNSYPFSPLRFITKEYDALRTRDGL